MFGLDSFGEWEDLILYKQDNRAVVEKSVWIDRLCCGSSGEFFSMRLVDIRHVGISTEMGLFIFLNMSRLEHLDYTLIGPSERLLLSSDYEEYLPKTCPPASNESTLSDNVLGSSKMHQMQQNLSYPTLMRGAQLSSYQSANLTRGPYTENLTHLDYVKYIDDMCTDELGDLSKLDKECD